MRHFLAVALVLSAACAGPREYRPVSESRNIITRAQLREYAASSAFEVIQRLRPQWLRLREEQSLDGPNDLAVYVDNARMGGRESLRFITVDAVEYIQYYDAAAATLRWGMGHGYGAILVSTVPALE